MNELTPVSNDASGALEDAGFQIYRGWSPKMIEDFVRHSHEPHILEYTPEDASRRFRDVLAAMQWRADARPTVYPLYRDDDLAGAIRYTTRPRVEFGADYSFAIRMYEISRGQRLAQGFMRAVQNDFDQLYDNPKIWLKTRHDNPAAQHLYERFGYETVAEDDENIYMTYHTNK